MLYRILAGDYPISILILLLLGYWARLHPSTLRDLWRDRSVAWAWIGRLAIALAVVIPLWVAAFDNWRVLLGYTMPAKDRWTSTPFEYTPPPMAVHWVSFGLIAVSLLVNALLYARSRNGIWLLLLPLLLGSSYFYFMNAIRMRVDALLRQAEESLRHPEPFGLSFTLFWSLGLYVFIASTILALYLALFALVAIPICLLYNLITRGGHPEPESLTVFQGISALNRTRERE